ncbi:MAG: HEAT repeat domain-containing protein [Elusimicrobiota bacterium]
MAEKPNKSDKQDLPLAANIVRALRAAIANFKIYPAASQIIKDSIANAYQLLQEFLKNNPSFILAEVQGKLVVNGKEISDPYILQLLTQQRIQSCSLKKELSAEELHFLISELAKKETNAQSSLKESIEEKKIANITVDQTKYTVLNENQIVLEKMDQLFRDGQDLPEILKNIREGYNLVNSLPDPEDRKKSQERLAERLATLPPATLREIFEQKLPAEIEDSGLKDQILASLSQDKIKEIFSDIARWYQEVRNQSDSDFDVIEKLGQLKNFLNKVLLSPLSHDVPFSLLEELLHIGLITEIPAWADKDKEKSLIAKVEEILEKDASVLLENPLRNKIPEIMKEICAEQLSELIDKFTGKIVENISQTTGKIQSIAVNSLAAVLEVLNKYDRDLSILQIEKAFKSSIQKTSDLEIYKVFLKIFSLLVNRDILKERYESAKQLILLLKKERLLSLPVEKKELISRTIKDSFEKITELLVRDFDSGIKSKEEGAAQIIYCFGDENPAALLKLVRETDSLRLHKKLALLLKDNRDIDSLIRRELSLDNHPVMIIRILEILPELGLINFLEELEKFVNFPEMEVKKKIICLLRQEEREETKKLLLRFLDDYDDKFKLEVVRVIAGMKYSPSVEKLISLAEAASAGVLEEICSALGILAGPQAGSGLIKILQGKKTWLSRSLPPEPVRIKVVWALRNFPSPEVENVLLQALKDKSGIVKKIAAESLNIIHGK